MVSRCESQYEVHQKCARVNPGVHIPVRRTKDRCTPLARGEGRIQGGIPTGPKAVVKEVAFNGWTNHACAKDVTKFDTPEDANLIVRFDFEVDIEPCAEFGETVVKSSGVTEILKHVRARIDRAVKTCSIKWRRRRRDLLVCDRLAGLKRNSHKRQQE